MESEFLVFTERGSADLRLTPRLSVEPKDVGSRVRGLGKTYRVIADWRGFGESPLAANGLTMESSADDVYQLLQQLGIHQKVLLLGISMEGMSLLSLSVSIRMRCRRSCLWPRSPLRIPKHPRRRAMRRLNLYSEKGVAYWRKN
jgi:hypothetical protein